MIPKETEKRNTTNQAMREEGPREKRSGERQIVRTLQPLEERGEAKQRGPAHEENGLEDKEKDTATEKQATTRIRHMAGPTGFGDEAEERTQSL